MPRARLGHGAVTVTLGVALMLAGSSPAFGQSFPVATWDDVAASADVPIYRPADTLGLPLQSIEWSSACHVGGHPRLIGGAQYWSPGGTTAKRLARGYIAVSQGRRNCPGGRTLPVRKVRIFGQTARVVYPCEGTPTLADCRRGLRNARRVRKARAWRVSFGLRGGPRRQRTEVSVDGVNVSVAQLLKVARSVTRVDLARPELELSSFRTADRGVFCQISIGRTVTCRTRGDDFGGTLFYRGTISLCVPQYDGVRGTCLPLYQDLPTTPTLQTGQRSAYGNIACSAEGSAITCTYAGGAAAGRGFRIDPASVTSIEP